MVRKKGNFSAYQLIFAQHDVPGLWNSLRIHIFHTEYRSSDGTWFRDEKFLYRNGTVQYFVSSFGGWGLMSGVMRGSVLYYTYWDRVSIEAFSGGCFWTITQLSFRKAAAISIKILRHCGLWKETPPRAPPTKIASYDQPPDGLTLDYEFFESLAG
ncbi:MAG: hypothetical protein JW913_08510 [Chitinispirillaceae bacterium]|nr:hypothetical protein [Chitinispirillaceae bacterium]